MSASFYDLLKYAKTGIASPSMTYYDRMRASTLMGATVRTLTGQPPLTFKADGTPLISWSMLGNGQQTGTPTPDNPVMPEFVGVRTAQLFEDKIANCSIDANGRLINNSDFDMYIAKVEQGVAYKASSSITGGFYTTKPIIGSVSYNGQRMVFAPSAFTAPITGYMTFRVNSGSNEPMLNLGSTALPYEPFGYKIPLTCAGQTVPVYLGQTQTVRKIKKLVLTGTENFNYDAVYTRFTLIIQNAMFTANRSDETPCTHYVSIYDGRSIDTVPDDSIYVTAGGGYVYINIKDTTYTNLADFKSYLAAQYAAGTPVCVWYVLATEQTGITNEPLAKIGDYADELSSEDASVTIPTVKGNNTLTVESELQPSEMTLTFKG